MLKGNYKTNLKLKAKHLMETSLILNKLKEEFSSNPGLVSSVFEQMSPWRSNLYMYCTSHSRLAKLAVCLSHDQPTAVKITRAFFFNFTEYFFSACFSKDFL